MSPKVKAISADIRLEISWLSIEKMANPRRKFLKLLDTQIYNKWSWEKSENNGC